MNTIYRTEAYRRVNGNIRSRYSRYSEKPENELGRTYVWIVKGRLVHEVTM